MRLFQGHTVDTNSTFLTRALRRLGVSVQRITVIPDIHEVIAKEVVVLSSQYTHLITSGGVGPTHDDITFESIAAAFQEEVYPHPDLTQLVEEYFGVTATDSPAMKLAMVPRSAKLNYGIDPQTGKRQRYPVVSELRIKNNIITIKWRKHSCKWLVSVEYHLVFSCKILRNWSM